MTPFDRYFAVGERYSLGSHRFDADAIVAFARKYDPQRFHVDAEAAKNSIFGGLCASGWHTTAIWMKKNMEHQATLFAKWRDTGLPAPEFGPSPGFRNLRWLRPVFAGETITFYLTVSGGRPLASRPGWHLMEMIGEAETEDGKPVLRFEPAVMIRF
ncbi:MAG TPA: MaoC family dehydratase [Pararhizobium sp.]|nr:MaoC family dehydratase [Pararhizobium sp.]